MPANKHVRVPVAELLDERLDTGFYSRAYFDAKAKLSAAGFDSMPVGKVCEPWQFGAYALCNHIEWSDEKNGVPYVKAEALGSPLVNHAGLSYVTRETHALLKKSRVGPGDIVVSTSGTIGLCAVWPASLGQGNSNQDTIKFNPNSKDYDNYFLAAWIVSRYGQAFLEREAGGGVQQHVYLYNFKRILLPRPDIKAQRYIGDKVRQAERLRERAAALQRELDALACPEAVRGALGIQDTKFNRLAASGLNARLDGKYYGRRAMAVLKACHEAGGVCIRDLKPKVSNGFEYREFSATGRPYITVSEVTSGRLDTTNAPRIPMDVKVPPKATVNPRCAFVVRTGSVGVAVKAQAEDSDACISSHLIRLEFDREAIAAAVAAWLNGSAGKCLQEKITYGGVQPQISQEELLELPLPSQLLDTAEQILMLWETRERCLRTAGRLVTAAKLLIEALIERRLSETCLIEAQRAIQHGDHTPDRDLLGRLASNGLDVTGAPKLFPDLDMLYRTLKDAESTAPAEAR